MVIRPCLYTTDPDRFPINNMQLQAANDTAIRTFGQRFVAVELCFVKVV